MGYQAINRSGMSPAPCIKTGRCLPDLHLQRSAAEVSGTARVPYLSPRGTAFADRHIYPSDKGRDVNHPETAPQRPAGGDGKSSGYSPRFVLAATS